MNQDGHWIDVSRQSPCPICDKPDWCRVSADGQLVACRRESRGAKKSKSDKNGAPVYLHRVGGPSVLTGVPVGDAFGRQSKTVLPIQSISSQRGDVKTLNRAYEFF